MMRLAKTNRLILLAAVLAAVLGALSWLQNGQEDVKQEVESEMAVATMRASNLNLDGLKARIETLKETEGLVSANVSQLERAFTGHQESVEVAEELYRIARENRVNLFIIISAGQEATEEAGIRSDVIPMTLTLRGEVADILDFIEQVHQVFPFSQVSGVTVMNQPGTVRAATADNYTSGEIYNAAEATLELVIQNYTLDEDDG